MESDIVLFWFVVISCVSGLIATLVRFRAAALGWAGVYVGILVVSGMGWMWEISALIYAGCALWLVLILVPALLSRWYYRCFLQQRYRAAYRVARIIRWLHPGDGWKQQPEILRALELAHQGNLTAATRTLQRLQDSSSLISLAAITNLYRITDQWEELLDWQRQTGLELDGHPQLLTVLLRAHGETGDTRGMVELYDRHKHQVAKLVPAASRDLCRLMLFAFCGQQDAVDRLMTGSLAILPASAREFWYATTELASGNCASAHRRLEQLLPDANPSVRRSIQRRLSQISNRPQPLDESALTVLEQAATEHRHDESFGARRSLFTREARATQILIVLNGLMFIAETLRGGNTNPETLYRLGGLYPPAIRAGGWWRLAASLFLHAGWLHLAMNMLALCVLGPVVEYALGLRRYLLVYLLAGVGSMSTVLLLASGPDGDRLTVGASGCIMGLVGATGALMLRGWRRERALAARQRLMAMVAIIAMQTAFDLMVPQVSMTGHLSGALLGFFATLILRDRLTEVPAIPLSRGPPLP